MDTHDNLLTSSQVKERTGLSLRVLENMRSRGYGPDWYQLGPRRVRYSEASLNEWLEAGRCAAAQPPSEKVVVRPAAVEVESPIDTHIREVVAAAPVLTNEQKWRLMALLVETPAARSDVA